MGQQTLDQSRESRKLPDRQAVHRWVSLHHGECVEVWPTGSYCYAAYVDDRAEDGRLIWVIEKDTGSRHLFVRGDPVTLYLI